jgi:hypothetical protein
MADWIQALQNALTNSAQQMGAGNMAGTGAAGSGGYFGGEPYTYP